MASNRSNQERRQSSLICGYEANFNPELDRKYICPICLAALRDPMQTSCGHRFCKNCIYNVLNGRAFGRCPVDNVTFKIGDELFEDRAFRREILSQNVLCSNVTDGCQWRGELRALEEHVLSCAFTTIECVNNCGVKILQLMLSEHLKICERRLVQCQHCQMSIPHADMTKHQLLLCQKFPVQCTLCGQGGIYRKDISKHIEINTGDCPLTVIPCQYATFGCQFQDKRRCMTEHYTEAANHHILLLVRRILDQDRRIAALESELLSVKDEQEKQGNTLISQSSTLDELQMIWQQNSEPVLMCLQNTYCSGSINWKIPLQSREARRQHFVSHSVYTGCPGFKVCANLELVGVCDVTDNYSSLFIDLEKGHFDDQLDFPFNAVCYVTLFDQSDNVQARQHHTDLFQCINVTRQMYDNYTNNGRRGKLKFMKTSDLLSDRFMKDGYLHLNIVVVEHNQQHGQMYQENIS